ncbi:hypothetical protein SY88_05910 [Clostridiales bacterium PH28_bin88]|nr:hypothetical protein SY88_05910 [Clostridiales bacterium PH28_bin88]
MQPATAVILSGGRNSRMKANKAFLEVESRPLIEGLVEKLGRVFPEVVVVTNEPEQYSHLGVKVVTDIIPRQGPLSGMHAGLTAATHRNSFVVACDMPFVESRLAEYLVEIAGDYDAVIPMVDGYYQPLYAVYAKTCLPFIEQCLREQVYQIIAFYSQVKVRSVGETELAAYAQVDRVFFNVNTPQELEAAREMATGRSDQGAARQG